MVAHTGLDKTNPSCLLKIHQVCWLEMDLSLQVGEQRGALCLLTQNLMVTLGRVGTEC